MNKGIKKLKMIFLYIFLFMVILGGAVILFSYWQENQLTVTNYEICSQKINSNVKIAMLSDLHNKEFGENNIEIINKLKENSPDFAVIVGDMTDRFDESENIDVVTKLIEQILCICPVYYSMGNHETENECKKIIEHFKDNINFHFLIDEEISTNYNGQDIVIYGLNLYPLAEIPGRQIIIDKCEKFYSHKAFKLMLCHNPEYFEYFFEDKPIDLVLSGHAHGGQIIIPGIGGIYAPNQGLFPKYYNGIYETETAKLLVGRGLGNLVPFPRINNPPELIFITLS